MSGKLEASIHLGIDKIVAENESEQRKSTKKPDDISEKSTLNYFPYTLSLVGKEQNPANVQPKKSLTFVNEARFGKEQNVKVTPK